MDENSLGNTGANPRVRRKATRVDNPLKASTVTVSSTFSLSPSIALTRLDVHNGS